MRILHCCLANLYVDGYGYQENVMTRVHKKQGHDVFILASTETIETGKGLSYTSPSSYVNEDGIPVCRIPYVGWLPHAIGKKIRVYKGVKDILEDFAPEVIFMHDAQTFAVCTIVEYVKKYPHVKVYVDSHTDFVNSARTYFSKNVLHGIFYKYCVKKIIPYARKFYGTLPARVAFYRDFYGTPADKTEYLPMGVDDLSIDFTRKEEIRNKIRQKLGISANDFVIISGGKLDEKKNTIQLLKALKEIEGENIKLVLFGKVAETIRNEFDSILSRHGNKIKYLDWLPATETYKYFWASDLACFPGTHSTLWEESVGYGLPGIYKKWEGIQHVDVGGNCIFLYKDTIEAIKSAIMKILSDKSLFAEMKRCAIEQGIEHFSYSKISEYAIKQ